MDEFWSEHMQSCPWARRRVADNRRLVEPFTFEARQVIVMGDGFYFLQQQYPDLGGIETEEEGTRKRLDAMKRVRKLKRKVKGRIQRRMQ